MTAAATSAAATDTRRVTTVRRVQADGRELLERTLGRTYPISDRLAAWAGELATKARLHHGDGHDLDRIVADLAFPAALKVGVAATSLLDEQPNLLSRGACAATAAAHGRGRITVTSALLATLEALAHDVIRGALDQREPDGDRRLQATRLIDRARDAIDGAGDAHIGDADAIAAALLDAAEALTDAAGLITRP